MIILDTCAILWDSLAPEKLSTKAKRRIDNADKGNKLIICDISIWEIAMLVKRNRISIDASSSEFINLYLKTRNIEIKRITPEIAELSVKLGAEINNDPADRLIAATSILYNAPIVTADQNLRSSKILETVW